MAEARPVIDDANPLCIPRHQSDRPTIIVVIGNDRDPMREKDARRIELSPIEPVDIAIAHQARGMIVRRFRSSFGQRVADTLARKDATVKETLLLFGALKPQAFQHEEMVLRYLSDRTVGG